jgi:GTP cyclohydrolase I
MTNNYLALSGSVRSILEALGEDINRPGLRRTPERAAKALLDLTSGYNIAASDILNDALFPCDSTGLVLQKNLEFYSLCEHHLLPFFGHIHVAYLPNKNIIGLSKIGRIIDLYARRLQVQEQLTHQIADALNELIKPHGLAVMISASHLCMMMRGVKKQGSETITSEFLGLFKSDQNLRSEFFSSLKNS